MKYFLPLFFLCLCLSSAAQYLSEDQRILNQFIVQVKAGHTIGEVTVSVADTRVLECLSAHLNIWLLERNGIMNAEGFLETLRNSPALRIAQFNHRVADRALIPDDTQFSQQWGMWNTGQNSGLAGADIEAAEAWDINHENVTVNGDTIVIAIVDGKFDLSHEDLDFFVNRGEIPGNSIDDDGNGYIDDVSGWNAYDNNGIVNATGFNANHGTHVCGIAGARGNNALGVAGVCWGAKILPISGSGQNEATVVKAYDYALTMRRNYNNSFGTQGAYVVVTNSSFGVDKGNPVDFPIWCAMYDSLGKEGVLSAGAAPNANLNIDTDHDIPTECPSKWLIGVTNTTRLDVKNGNSGYGKINVDLGAPGTTIYSTVPMMLNGYNNLTGTSMATPHVAGSVAAMYAAACKAMIDASYENPDSIALFVRRLLLESAEWNSSLNNISSTGGRLNLYRAVRKLREFNCDSCNFNTNIQKSDISCRDANDGAMLANLSNGAPSDYTFFWSNGSNDPEIVSSPPGFYGVTVTGGDGCRRSAFAELYNPDSIKVTSITALPALNGNAGNVIVTAGAGNAVLQYSLDGTNWQSSSTLTFPENGELTVYIKTETGCIIQRQITVSSVSEIETNFDFLVYPNPARDQIFLSLQGGATGELTVKVLDLLGRAIRTIKTEGQTHLLPIDVSGWSSGVYNIKINNQFTKINITP